MVKSGEAQDYYLTARNKKLTPVTAVPAAAANCAKEKKMPAPGKAGASCTGQRLAAEFDHTRNNKGARRYAVRCQGWRICGAASVGARNCMPPQPRRPYTH